MRRLPDAISVSAFFSMWQGFSLMLCFIVFIYSCPSTSPIKGRMVYSLAAASLMQTAKGLLAGSRANLVTKKLETSDPSEIDAQFIVSRLNLDREDPEGSSTTTSRPGSSEPKAFAKPKGPGRRAPR